MVLFRTNSISGFFIGQRFLAFCLVSASALLAGCYEHQDDPAALDRGPPTELQYSQNPANYFQKTQITPNVLTGKGATFRSFEITTPLPDGLVFDPLTGTITGIPEGMTAAADYYVIVRNEYGSGMVKLALAVNDIPPTITYAGSTTLEYQVGTQIDPVTPTLDGGATISCISIPELPGGLSLSAACELTGTPIVPSPATTYIITAVNSGGGAGLPLTIRVIDIPPQLSYSLNQVTGFRGIALLPIPATNDGGAITSCGAEPSLPQGLVLGNDCTVSGTPTESAAKATYRITGTNSGGSSSADFTVTVGVKAPEITFGEDPVTAMKDVALTPKSPVNPGGAIDGCTSVPPLPEGLSLSDQCEISGTPKAVTAAAQYAIKATNSAGESTATVEIEVRDRLPTIQYVSKTLTYTYNTAITPLTPIIGGGAIVKCESTPALPSGLSISATDCVISGKPTISAAAAYYRITASNSGGSASDTVKITVTEVKPGISYPGGPFKYKKAIPITALKPANNGGVPSACTVDPPLPAGLALSSACGISGTPSAITAAATYTVTGSNSAGSSIATLSIEVTETPPTLSYTGSPFDFTKSVAIATLTPSNSGGPITECTSSPGLPAGLSVSTTCVITGTPTALSEKSDYQITAKNDGGSVSATISITVKDVPPNVSYVGSPFNFTLDTAISVTSPSNTGGAITECVISPDLPAGLQISQQCQISGTPTELSALKSYTITARNSGGSAGASIGIAVKASAPSISFSQSSFTFPKGSEITPVVAANSGGPLVSCTASPSLPAGLIIGLNPDKECAISGTPSALSGATLHTITATNTGGSSSASITITVNDLTPSLTYDPSDLSLTKGIAMAAADPQNAGGTVISCASNPNLPAGLVLSNTCKISGTPTAVTAQRVYSITATNSGGSATASITIAVNDIPPDINYADNPFSFTKGSPVAPATPNNNGGTITECASSPTLPAGLSLSSTCGISGTPTVVRSAADYTITAKNSGGTSEKTINITVRDIPPAISYPDQPFTFVKGTIITPIPVTNTGGAISGCDKSALPAGLALSAQCTITGTPSVVVDPAGSYTITAHNSGGDSPVTIGIRVIDVAPSISYSGTTFTFTRGSAIAALVAANAGGGIDTCTKDKELPAGLSLDASTCTISGTPTAVEATDTYKITAENTGGSSSVTLTLTVNEPAPVISYLPGPFTYTFTKGSAIAPLTPSHSGGEISNCSASPALPSGLSIAAADCSITGTPNTIASSKAYTITASNTGGSSSEVITITVNDAAPALSYAGPFTFTINATVGTISPTSTGGEIINCSSNPALPAGLNLANNCTITGIPSVPVYPAQNFTISATNSGGTVATSISIRVNDHVPTISYAQNVFTYTKGTLIAPVTPTLGGGTVTNCAVSPALPAGLALNSTTCVISGTPTVIKGSTAYTITAENSGGNAQASIDITVKDIAPALTYGGSPYILARNSLITPIAPNSTGGAIVSCTADSLPANLNISAQCVITGTPSAVVDPAATVTVHATNTGGTTDATLAIRVLDIAPAIAYNATTFTFTKDVAITPLTVTNSGGGIDSCTRNKDLPAGLSLNASTCTISGTPTSTAAADNYIITASNNGGSSSVTLTITVNQPAPVISYIPGPYTYAFTKGTAIAPLTPSHSGGPISNCTASPALPAGLSLDPSDCSMTGMPTSVVSSKAYTITASNTGGSSAEVLTLSVKDIAPALNFAGGPFAYTVDANIGTLAPNSTGGDITACVSDLALPTGLHLSDQCVITGTPTEVKAAKVYTLTATNSGGSTSATVNIAVKDHAPVLSYGVVNHTFLLRSAIGPVNPTNTGGAITECASSPPLPTGIGISSDCRITGTPSITALQDNYTITAKNSGGQSTATLTIRVKNQPQILYYSKTALNGSVNGTAAGSYNVWKVSLDGVDRVALTQNSNALLNSSTPSFKPGGASVVYASSRALNGATNGVATDSLNIWTSLATGLTPVARIQNSAGNLDSEDPVFSPDGTKIAFASKTAVNGSVDGSTSRSYNIWIMNADGTGRTALTANTDNNLDSRNPVFSPDGNVIYFASKNDPTGANNGAATSSYNIWKININGTGKTQLTNETLVNHDCIEPAIAPSGNKLVYASRSDIGVTTASSYNIWEMNTDGSGKTPLTANTAAELDSRYASFSQDGSEIVFSSMMNVNAATAYSFNIWKMSFDGQNQVPLTTNNPGNTDSIRPSFSPDGTRIVFASRNNVGVSVSDSFNIWVINSDGTGSPLALTSNTSIGLDSYLASQGVWYQE